MPIAVLESLCLTFNGLIGVTPGVVRREKLPVGMPNRQSRWYRPARRRIHHRDQQPADGFEIAAGARDDPLALAAGDGHRPQRRVAGLVGDVSDPRAVWRPARRGRVELTVCELNGLGALTEREPELVPLPSVVAAVDDAPGRAIPVWPGLPGGFLIVDFARGRTCTSFHPPQPARSVDPAAIRDEDQFLAVGRPRRRQVVIEAAVVVARLAAVPILGDAYRRIQPRVRE